MTFWTVDRPNIETPSSVQIYARGAWDVLTFNLLPVFLRHFALNSRVYRGVVCVLVWCCSLYCFSRDLFMKRIMCVSVQNSCTWVTNKVNGHLTQTNVGGSLLDNGSGFCYYLYWTSSLSVAFADKEIIFLSRYLLVCQVLHPPVQKQLALQRSDTDINDLYTQFYRKWLSVMIVFRAEWQVIIIIMWISVVLSATQSALQLCFKVLNIWKTKKKNKEKEEATQQEKNKWHNNT